jgi:hypothetical protein
MQRPSHRNSFWSAVCPNLISNHSWYSHQSSLAITSSSKAGETWWEMAAEFCLWSISFTLHRVSLTCHKILWHGTDGFTSSPKKVVLRIFICLKIHCSWPGLNPQILGQMDLRYKHYHPTIFVNAYIITKTYPIWETSSSNTLSCYTTVNDYWNILQALLKLKVWLWSQPILCMMHYTRIHAKQFSHIFI